MQDLVKDWWSQIVLVILVAIGYGRNSQQLKDVREDVEKHIKKSDDSEYITLPQHDRMQEACRTEWKGEFGHIRNEMNTGFNHITESLIELKSDIKDLRNKK